jgi:hypothetical protein
MWKILYYITRNLMIFFCFAYAMPGISSPGGIVLGYLVVGFIYGVLMLILPDILRFMKFPVSFFGKLFVGTLLTFIMMILVHYFMTSFLTIGPGYFGNMDFIIFTSPMLLELPNFLAVIFTSSIILNLLSMFVEYMGS